MEPANKKDLINLKVLIKHFPSLFVEGTETDMHVLRGLNEQAKTLEAVHLNYPIGGDIGIIDRVTVSHHRPGEEKEDLPPLSSNGLTCPFCKHVHPDGPVAAKIADGKCLKCGRPFLLPHSLGWLHVPTAKRDRAMVEAMARGEFFSPDSSIPPPLTRKFEVKSPDSEIAAIGIMFELLDELPIDEAVRASEFITERLIQKRAEAEKAKEVDDGA